MGIGLLAGNGQVSCAWLDVAAIDTTEAKQHPSKQYPFTRCCAVLCNAWRLWHRAAPPKNFLVSVYNFCWFNWFVCCVSSHTTILYLSLQLIQTEFHYRFAVAYRTLCCIKRGLLISRFAVSSIVQNMNNLSSHTTTGSRA